MNIRYVADKRRALIQHRVSPRIHSGHSVFCAIYVYMHTVHIHVNVFVWLVKL